jgi:predicted component of type VI protein secretion system
MMYVSTKELAMQVSTKKRKPDDQLGPSRDLEIEVAELKASMKAAQSKYDTIITQIKAAYKRDRVKDGHFHKCV